MDRCEWSTSPVEVALCDSATDGGKRTVTGEVSLVRGCGTDYEHTPLLGNCAAHGRAEPDGGTPDAEDPAPNVMR